MVIIRDNRGPYGINQHRPRIDDNYIKNAILYTIPTTLLKVLARVRVDKVEYHRRTSYLNRRQLGCSCCQDQE